MSRVDPWKIFGLIWRSCLIKTDKLLQGLTPPQFSWVIKISQNLLKTQKARVQLAANLFKLLDHS